MNQPVDTPVTTPLVPALMVVLLNMPAVMLWPAFTQSPTLRLPQITAGF